MTDGQTDRHTDARGKTICHPTLAGGRHKNMIKPIIPLREKINFANELHPFANFATVSIYFILNSEINAYLK